MSWFKMCKLQIKQIFTLTYIVGLVATISKFNRSLMYVQCHRPGNLHELHVCGEEAEGDNDVQHSEFGLGHHF